MASISFSLATFLAINILLTLKISFATTKTNERLTRLHFYLHERYKTPNATIIKVVSCPTDKLNHNCSFGDMFVLDNLITEAHEPTSRLLGRAQGTTTITSLDGSSWLTTINLVFTDLYPWTGSSLTLIGAFSTEKERSELSLVGGTYKFQFARGYAVLRSLTSNDVNINTFEMEVILLDR